jgi:hypothetical protein
MIIKLIEHRVVANRLYSNFINNNQFKDIK